MKVTPVSPKLSVAGQPELADIAALADEGFTTLINNRPDGEEPAQPGSAAEREAAAACGVGYLDLPVTSASIGRADIARFREALAAAPGPVLAHCRSGTRSLTLYVLGEVLDGRMRQEDVLAYGAELGFDLTGAVAWLNARAADPGGRTQDGHEEAGS